MLLDKLAGGELTAASIARGLGLSERTLHRRLRAENSSFADILDATRGELAKTLLPEPEIGVGEIAFLLGYSEPSVSQILPTVDGQHAARLPSCRPVGVNVDLDGCRLAGTQRATHPLPPEFPRKFWEAPPGFEPGMEVLQSAEASRLAEQIR